MLLYVGAATGFPIFTLSYLAMSNLRFNGNHEVIFSVFFAVVFLNSHCCYNTAHPKLIKCDGY